MKETTANILKKKGIEPEKRRFPTIFFATQKSLTKIVLLLTAFEVGQGGSA